MSSTTATATVEALRAGFARFGLPLGVVSDNGLQFTSDCFAEFVRANAIRHYIGTPYHPATNGLAERIVQTIKKAVRRSASDPDSLQTRLSRFLMVYRNTPHPATGSSPAYALMGHSLRLSLNLLKPLPEAELSPTRAFSVGESVLVRDFRPGKTEQAAVV